jgi:DNA-binding LacI/PurR family transcriptional regulator
MSAGRIETRRVRQIEDGPFGNRIRMTDLARLAGVSVATVSRSLSDSRLINRMTKRRVWQIASDHGYVAPHDMPEGLQGSLATLALIVPAGFPDPLPLDLLAAIIGAAREARCDLVISYLPERQRDLASFMDQAAADAFFFLGQAYLQAALADAAGRTQKFVVWGEAAEAGYCAIGPDNFSGGYLAARYLIEAGCRRIAWLGGHDGPDMGQRFRGYLRAMGEAGLSLDPDLLLNRLSAGSFDGLLCASDALFPAAINHLAGQVRLAGFHQGRRPHADRETACVSTDMAEAGRRIISSLLGAASGTRQPPVKLPVSLSIQ